MQATWRQTLGFIRWFGGLAILATNGCGPIVEPDGATDGSLPGQDSNIECPKGSVCPDPELFIPAITERRRRLVLPKPKVTPEAKGITFETYFVLKFHEGTHIRMVD